MTNLSTKYLGLDLRNPIIAGSSGLTDNIDGLLALEKAGAGAIVLKSLFEEEILQEMQANISRSNSDLFLYPETVDYYEYLDTPKESPEQYLDLIKEAKQKLTIPIIASINCQTASQWTYFPKRIEAAGADALELNLFIMPTDFNRSSADNEKIYFDIVNEVRKQVKIPVSLKVSFYFSNLGAMLKKLSESGVQGLVLFNRFYNPDIDIEKLEITSGYIMSNPAEISQSLRWIAIMSQRVKCSLAASTGVHDGKAAIKQILAGADAVQIASVIYKQGPEVITTMLAEIETWMKHKKFNKIADFKGKLSQAQSTNAAAFERVQFMKYFREHKSQLN
jgi:dihydroorotate dehydrogenase (fumarate)